MHKPFLAVALSLAVTACATATPIYDQNGEAAMLISCDGAAVPMSACYNKAAEVCPGGYFLLGSEDRHDGAIIGPYGGGTINTKSVAVRCKS
jgi:hypothetical protein